MKSALNKHIDVLLTHVSVCVFEIIQLNTHLALCQNLSFQTLFKEILLFHNVFFNNKLLYSCTFSESNINFEGNDRGASAVY